MVWSPRMKVCSLFDLHLYTQVPVIFDLSLYQTRPALLSGRFCKCYWPSTVCQLGSFFTVEFIRIMNHDH